MVDIRLLGELEKLFKKEPFNYENTILSVEASYGSIKVDDNLSKIEEHENEVIQLGQKISELEDEISILHSEKVDNEDLIEYLKELLYENGIEYE